MGALITELYEARKEAGAKAAETVAAYDNKFTKIAIDLGALKWIRRLNIAATIAIQFVLLRL